MEFELEVAVVAGALAGAAAGVLVVLSVAVEGVVLSVPAVAGFSDVSLPPGFILSE